MNKFYLGMLVISFLYGCSTTPSKQQSRDQSSPVVIISPEPKKSQRCSTTGVGEAAVKILKRKGYLSDDDC